MMENSPLTEMAERLIADTVPSRRDGFDRTLWQAVEEAGLDRLLLPEKQGGAGDAFQDAAGVVWAFGRAAAGIPLAETMVANWCLARGGREVAPGPKALLLGPDLHGARLSDDGRLVPARALPIVWASVSSRLVVIGQDQSGRDVLIDCDVPAGLRPGETICGEPLAWMNDATGLSGGSTELANDAGSRALPLALVLISAAMAGAMERICGMTIDYANTRKQFGKPISRFQAVQHMAARMASETAACRSAVEVAAGALGGDHALWAAAVAKARVSEAAGLVAADAHQIHGAMGYTREYDLHRLTRRLWSWRERFGNEALWHERIGRGAVAAGSKLFWPSLVRGMEL